MNSPFYLFAYTNGDSIEQQSKINLGISAGPNFTHVVKDFYASFYYSKDKQPPMISYAGSFCFQYNLNKSSSIRAEIFYERKKLDDTQYAIYTIGNVPENIKAYYSFERITVPVFYRLTFNKLFIDAGMNVAWTLRSARYDISEIYK